MVNFRDNPINFRKTVTSQWGDDGIIEEIFNRLGAENKFCVEFGAWDGKYLSNVWDLWHNKGWSAILIEGEEERAKALQQSVQNFETVKTYNAFVSPQGENSLDQILAKLKAPTNLDLLSVDIDGDDYYVFESLAKFTPRVVVIEYNPTIPPEIDLIQAQGEHFGASALALVNLARKKGYRLVCCTESNCFFVLYSEYPKLKILEPPLHEVLPRDHLTYVITSFDGCAFLSRQPTYLSPVENVPESPTLGDFIRRRPRARPSAPPKHPKLIVQGLEEILPIRLFRS
jgi:methyltransferase FkbM-like protein